MTYPNQTLLAYFQALDRLKNKCPINVPKGTKITNDAVALEAGRGKGSIKKSRPVFLALIEAIAAASEDQKNGSPKAQQKVEITKFKDAADRDRKNLDAITISLIARISEIYELKKKVRELEEQLKGLNEKLHNISNSKFHLIKKDF